MSRLRKIDVAMLNIVTHPHSPEKYVEIFSETFMSGRHAKIRGHDGLAIGSMSPLVKGKSIDGLAGRLYRFVNIDHRLPWLNASTMAPIKSEDGEPVFPIPEELKPNLREIDYVFYPKGHRLFYDLDGGQPSGIGDGLRRLFNISSMIEKYGEILVHVETSDEQLKQILKTPSMSKLRIDMTMPNGDDLEDAGERFKNKLKNIGANKVDVEYTGTQDEPLTPEKDEETLALLHLAQSNGNIQAEGWDGNRKVVRSTKSHPRTIRGWYDPNQQSGLSKLVALGRSALDGFVGAKRR